MTKTVLVTGADGFAGSWLVDDLITYGYTVKALVRSSPLKNLKPRTGIEVVSGDLLDLKSLEHAMKDVDQVFHLAAVSGVEETRRMPEQAWEVNTRGTLNVLRAALANNVSKVLVTSTCHVIGSDIYAASKRATEEICSVYADKIPIVITRAYNHFGPRQRPEWLIPRIIIQALNRKDYINLGNPNPQRDFTYVSDIVDGYRLAMEKGRGMYTFCSGVMRPVHQVVDTIIDVLNWNGIVVYDQSKYRTSDFTLHASDFDKARADLGWKPFVSFENGIKMTIDWYRGRAL